MDLSYVFVVAVLSCCSGVIVRGETDAEAAAVAVTIDGITQSQFDSTRAQFQTVVAHYSSIYCKDAEGHCDGDDKQIRLQDVNVPNNTAQGTAVVAEVYVSDRFDTTQHALTHDQLTKVFTDYSTDISTDYGYPVGVEPVSNALEGWEIALIVIGVCCFLAIIIGVAICCSKSKKKEKAAEIDRRRSYASSRYEDVSVATREVSPVADAGFKYGPPPSHTTVVAAEPSPALGYSNQTYDSQPKVDDEYLDIKL